MLSLVENMCTCVLFFLAEMCTCVIDVKEIEMRIYHYNIICADVM
jgi:hypothetical protein